MPPPGIDNGDGTCKECKNGEWECGEHPCEGAGGGGKPKYKRLGRVWMSMGERSRKTEKPRCPIITLRYTSRQPSGPVPKEEEGLTP
jgi:hypothetical protein